MQEARLEKLKETLKQGYVNFLPNEILLDSRLHASSVKIFCILSAVSFADNFTSFYSQKTLAFLADFSVRTISRAIKELVSCGYIKKQFRLGETSIITLVHKFAQTVTNTIKDKVNKAKEKIKGNKDNNKKGNFKSEKQSTFNNFEQRTYNFDELEKKLLGWDQPKVDQFGVEYSQGLLL
jgi:DNA-binding transcriptional MocR family regulator